MPEDFADREDDEEEDDVEESIRHAVLPDSEDLFLTLTEMLSQPSQGGIPDHEAIEGSSAANVSSLPPLSQIRWRKKRTHNEMFSELMQASHTERAQQKVWRDTIAQDRKAVSNREERWRQEDQRRQDATLGLLREQMDMIRRLVEVQERQLERLLLQPLFNGPPSSPSSIATASPRCPRTRRGGGSGHPTTPPQWTEGCHSTSIEVAFSFPPPLLPHPTWAILTEATLSVQSASWSPYWKRWFEGWRNECRLCVA
ncbi:uncharacterized protein LOC128838849 [Malaclemys terrapin pileata]|uniref:uncharacterized protein LOC128838849 n=1 Tax=Malaclemys terrapin pileata TaxID=2991368 RepID=UPI0023A82013|nr:uncharacterized protein LOC128838849 [Malaclemys terrapin pileata]XP_053887273.1 uncharacterized protein LOC128838849 [Malaclemys terrapin pileata]